MGMKGHPQSNCGEGGSGGGGGWMMNKKMVMVVLLILVGLMGVMVVQKVRDRRLFNLVIKDKDRQILSLNLLLQKERQYAKENKRKNQDLNAKLYSLRTQKTELNNKIMEMRSTIGSMRDEHRALELAIDEKQNEIKLKESEIKELKTNFQTPPKIWSVRSNDSLHHEANLTTKVIERGTLFGQSNNVQKPKDQEIINPDVNDNAKIEMHNATDGRPATKETWGSEENGNGLATKGRRFFIGASESQRGKSNDEKEKGQVEARIEEGSTEVARLESNRRRGEVDRMAGDEAETEVDVSTSRNGSQEDQDYKKETEG